MIDQRWLDKQQYLQTFPCSFCGAPLGQPCVVVSYRGHGRRSKPENVGKPVGIPHAARYELDRQANPPYGRRF